MERLALTLSLILAASAPAEEPRRDRYGDPLPPGAVARLGTVNAHPGASTVMFSADGQTILTTSPIAVRYWDATTGRVRHVLHRPLESEYGCSIIAADGRTAATLIDGRLELFDLERGQILHRLIIDQPRDASKRRWAYEGIFCFSPRGDLVLIRLDGAKDVLVARQGKLEKWASIDGGFVDAVFSADGRWVALRSKIDGDILFRGTAANAPVTKARGGPIHAIAPDGSMIAVGPNESENAGHKLRLLDSRTGQAVPGGELPLADAARTACFSADGRLLAVATQTDVSLWDVATKKRRWHVAGTAAALAFSSDARRLAGIDHLLRTWDVATGESFGPDFGPLPGYLHSARNNLLVAGNFVTNQMQVWDCTTARPRITIDFGRSECFASGWLSADGRRLYACSPHNAEVWDIATRKRLRQFNPTPRDLDNKNWIMAWAGHPTPDGAAFSVLLAEGSEFQDRTRCVFVHWDADAGKQLYRREFNLPPFRLAGISRDPWAIWLYESSDFSRYFDARTGRNRPAVKLAVPEGASTSGSQLDQPGQRYHVICRYPKDDGDPRECVVVEAATRQPLVRIPFGVIRTRTANSVSTRGDLLGQALSPDGRRFVIARRAGIELWDLVEQRKFPFHPGHAERGFTNRGPEFLDLRMEFVSNDRLLVEYGDLQALIWELPAAAQTAPTSRMSAATWDELGDDRPVVALRAVWALTHDPKAGLELLRWVKRVDAPDAAVLAALWADLGSREFATREAATKALRKLGRSAETFLLAALAKPASTEQARRAGQLLAEIESDGPKTTDERRAIRVVHAAELLGDAGRTLLTDWAKGDPAAVLTREAKASVEP